MRDFRLFIASIIVIHVFEGEFPSKQVEILYNFNLGQAEVAHALWYLGDEKIDL